MGFFSALGTMEYPGMVEVGQYVKKLHPFTYDTNNGTIVVYDEQGRPWIESGRKAWVQQILDMQDQNPDLEPLKHGAYVPHSNDGGYFMNEVLPRLRGEVSWEKLEIW